MVVFLFCSVRFFPPLYPARSKPLRRQEVFSELDQPQLFRMGLWKIAHCGEYTFGNTFNSFYVKKRKESWSDFCIVIPDAT